MLNQHTWCSATVQPRTCCDTKLRLQKTLTKPGLSDALRQLVKTLAMVKKSLLPATSQRGPLAIQYAGD